ncbi:ADP-ribosylglycohydrolase family protein [Ideonella sp. A 288]|uniref:ADP-ribosylglycohydrolase family protein n=1 Tax=Ideonella sp. A 288 TaxID=1962181 RepID=UPI001F33383D|nr:ADP-ribosylglycohydrolase family protein [Ideonella sp. A 288]
MRYPTRLDDRFAGVMLGLACGDAVGATTEFLERGTFEPVTDMIGGGVYELEPGEWTDDTSMAMCLAESLVASESFDPMDQMIRYLSWYRRGYWSAKAHCFDIGQTTEHAIRLFEKTRHPWCGPTHAITAGNGSVMRLGPVVLRYFPNEDEVLHCAAESSRTTHGATLAVEGCRLLAQALLNLLKGCPKDRCLEGAAQHVAQARLRRIADGAFLKKPRSRIQSSGFVVHTLEAALWCLNRTASFEDAVLLAANLGDDADTVGAVTGQLAGAHYGASGIPDRWLQRLHRKNDIETLALCLRRL